MTWLKMDHATPEKPEVMAITVRMGWDDTDMTVGKLFRLWRWFDQQTVDGNAQSVSAALLDRMLGVSGFCAAVAAVGWLVVTDHGVSLPNFDKHNGQTAKDRANTAKRVAKHSGKRSTNAIANGASVSAGVSEALPREEKNREEEKQCTHTPLAREWALPKPWGEWAIAEYPHWTPDTVRSIAAQFADHWRASQGTSADWQATWQKWCRDELTQRANAKPREPPKPAVSTVRGAEPFVPAPPLTDEQRASMEAARIAAMAKFKKPALQ